MRHRPGYSLVELLVTMLVLAVLAAIVMPRLWSSRGSAERAAVQTALRTLIPAEEMYRGDSSRYTTELARLTMVRGTPHVTITIDRADAETWHATATYDGGAVRCEVLGGVGSPGGTAGTISCP